MTPGYSTFIACSPRAQALGAQHLHFIGCTRAQTLESPSMIITKCTAKYRATGQEQVVLSLAPLSTGFHVSCFFVRGGLAGAAGRGREGKHGATPPFAVRRTRKFECARQAPTSQKLPSFIITSPYSSGAATAPGAILSSRELQQTQCLRCLSPRVTVAACFDHSARCIGASHSTGLETVATSTEIPTFFPMRSATRREDHRHCFLSLRASENLDGSIQAVVRGDASFRLAGSEAFDATRN